MRRPTPKFKAERFVTLVTILVVCIMVTITQATGEVQGWGKVFAAYLASVLTIAVSVPLAYQIADAYEQLIGEIRAAATVSMRRSKNGGWNVPDHLCPGCGIPLDANSAYTLGKDDHYILIMPACSAKWIENGWALYHDPSAVQ